MAGEGWLAIWIRFEHVCLLARRGGNLLLQGTYCIMVL
jgi:hypothetical protein